MNEICEAPISLIRKIEEISMNAFPALSTVLLNGWILRFSEGYGRRANSVNPIYPCSNDVMENIPLSESMYEKAGLGKVFKLTECSSGFQLDSILESRGYHAEARTNIMLRELSLSELSDTDRDGVVIETMLSDKWLDAFIHINEVNGHNASILGRMLHLLIPQAYYAYLEKDGRIIAVGLGVAEQGYIGMFDIVVDKAFRRQGLGSRIMNGLMHAGAAAGCHSSYLQVVDANEGAKLLYDKLGYKKHYSYWYRVKS